MFCYVTSAVYISYETYEIILLCRSYTLVGTPGHRRLADGIVHCAGSATYQIFLGYRSRTRTRP